MELVDLLQTSTTLNRMSWNAIVVVAGVLLGLAVLFWLARRWVRRHPAVLCPNCQLNHPRYCHLPMRPKAIVCEDYTPKGRH